MLFFSRGGSGLSRASIRTPPLVATAGAPSPPPRRQPAAIASSARSTARAALVRRPSWLQMFLEMFMSAPLPSPSRVYVPAQRPLEGGSPLSEGGERLLVLQLRHALAALGLDHGEKARLTAPVGGQRCAHLIARRGQDPVAVENDQMMRLPGLGGARLDLRRDLVAQAGKLLLGLSPPGLGFGKRGSQPGAPNREVH